MEQKAKTAKRFRDLKRTTKINIGVAAALFALLSGFFFLVKPHTTEVACFPSRP